MEDMGMTDKQFAAFLRAVIRQIEEIDKKLEKEELRDMEIKEKVKDLLSDFQMNLAD